MLPLLVLLVTIAGAWYLLIVRPQKDQQTRHGRLVDQLQVGDHVLTVGGIYGRVAAIAGASVVLELAPGLTTRIATDGIARIVHAGEAAIPTTSQAAVPATTEQAPHERRDTQMQDQPHPHDALQPPHHQYQQPAPAFAAPAWAPPAQPYAPAQPVQQQPHLQHHQQPQPVAHHQAAPPSHAVQPQPATTLRAHVVGSTIPTFEPRPWTDVAPVNAPQAQPRVQAPAPVAAPVPMMRPFAAQPQPQAMVEPAPVPVHHHPQQFQQQYHQQYAHPQPVAVAAPVEAAPVAAPVAAAVPGTVQEERMRRHSRAPQGMGSTLRLDDPSLRDTMTRARSERSGLADEYRKLTAPLVDVGGAPAASGAVPVHAVHDAPVMVGHDPNGVPLFVAPGSPVAQPVAHYPAPARPEAAANAVPRPVVQPPASAVDPALSSSAFQRRAPYVPTDPALAPAPQPAGTPVPAASMPHLVPTGS